MAKNTSTRKANPDMPLGKQNYILMLVGVALIAFGFILLAGGGSDSPDEFNYAMFNARRLVAAPLFLLAGLAVEVVAIMKRPKKSE